MRGFLLAVLALLALASCRPDLPDAAAGPACQVLHVTDGDTLHLDCGAGRFKARLLGFDTPESHEPRCPAEARAARAATEELRRLVARAPVTAQSHGHDRYGRTLVRLTAGGQDVAQAMIASGLALPYDGGRRPDWCARLQG